MLQEIALQEMFDAITPDADKPTGSAEAQFDAFLSGVRIVEVTDTGEDVEQAQDQSPDGDDQLPPRASTDHGHRRGPALPIASLPR